MLAFQEEEGAGLGQQQGKSCWAGVLLEEGSTGERGSPQRSFFSTLCPSNPAQQSPFPRTMAFESQSRPHEWMQTQMRKMRAALQGAAVRRVHVPLRSATVHCTGPGSCPTMQAHVNCMRREQRARDTPSPCYSYLNHSWAIVGFLEALN